MKRFLISLIAVLMLLSLFSCTNGDDDNVEHIPPEHETIDLYAVSLPEYKGLIVIQRAGENRGEAVWRVVLEDSHIAEYPSEFLSYYKSQTLEKYKIMASNAGMNYAELLEALDMTETDVESEACELAKNELVMLALIKKEQIELTEDEKARLFDRYAEKIASEIGRDTSYVKENLADEVYDTMLHDKTIEFLITQNTFVTEE